VESAGREIGRELAPRTAVAADVAMRSVLSALGFEPKLQDDHQALRC
jgi:hypothetical protein